MRSRFRPKTAVDSLLPSGGDGIIGVSVWAKTIRKQITQVARFPSGVLITGPNGTGKELIARAIHAQSDRAGRLFIPVDCTAFVSDLFASHVFGHVAGAFTGAHHDSLGCFRAANGGTVFLDEVGELEIPLQAKLLRVIEEKAVVPVGAANPIPINVRIIAATNRDLQQDVSAGRFRKDLYYRLNVVELVTTPLKDRLDDVELLTRHFVHTFCSNNGLPTMTVCGGAIALLEHHDWPGNVRELKNVLERAILFAKGPSLTGRSLSCAFGSRRQDAELTNDRVLPTGDVSQVDRDAPQRVVERAAYAPERCDAGEWLTLADLERYHIQETLVRTFYNQTAAADLLGISRHVLSNLIKKYKLDASKSRSGRPGRPRHSNRPHAR